MKKHLKAKKTIWNIGFVAAVSIFWLIIRTGRKPSRIVYPCQQAAIANVNIFLLVLFAPLLDLRKLRAALPHVLNHRVTKTLLLLSSLLLTFGTVLLTGSYAPSGTDYLPVPLNLKPQNAPTSAGSSNLFFVENASGVKGNMDAAISTLLSLMQSHSLFFFKTTSQPAGLIDRDDVVLIKVNSVGPERAGTNTDLVKSLIARIVNHPEGFSGEIVVADNGQGGDTLDFAENNAYDHSQSIQDAVNTFSSHKVSTWVWDKIRFNSVNEYSQGNFNDGYVVNSTENPITHLRVSYPKFKTKYGTYISLKKGIWSTTTSSYNSGKLKIINVPVLKSHSDYGVTACVKNYMGVVSQSLTNTHAQIKYGALGTAIAETRFPTLTILDCIWVNANPKESGSNCGPTTPYEVASFTNVIGASQDPVALEYWASKHVLIPAAIQKKYTAYSSLNPDYTPVTPGLTESYHNYLERSMNELKKANYQVTMNETEMNVYISTPWHDHTLFEDGFEAGSFIKWTGTIVTSGETASIVNTRSHHGVYGAKFTSNGGGGYERAYCYKTITFSSELYARGYFYVSQSGLMDDNDRFYFAVFRAGSNSVAYGGWRRIGGITKWALTIRHGTSYVDIYSSASPSLNRWYSIELHWKKDAVNGLAELWADGTKVCSVSGKNTATHGQVNLVRFGLAETYNCGSTIVYADCAKIATTYIGPEPSPYIFSDGFESGSFSRWSGTSISYGETASVVNTRSHKGLYSAKFTSNGGGGTEYAYCYKTITLSSELYARGYFYVSQLGIVENDDRIYFIVFRAGSSSVAYAGWRKTAGITKWFLTIRDGTSYVTAYSSASPLSNRWYCVELHWKNAASGLGELWIDGTLVCSITGKNTAYYGNINLVRFGLPQITNCGATTAYCDDCVISKTKIGPTPATPAYYTL